MFLLLLLLLFVYKHPWQVSCLKYLYYFSKQIPQFTGLKQCKLLAPVGQKFDTGLTGLKWDAGRIVYLSGIFEGDSISSLCPASKAITFLAFPILHLQSQQLSISLITRMQSHLPLSLLSPSFPVKGPRGYIGPTRISPFYDSFLKSWDIVALQCCVSFCYIMK